MRLQVISFPNLFVAGEVWIHHIVYYGSGQSVLLEHCRLNGNSYEIEMQDVTDNYRCILDLPILV